MAFVLPAWQVVGCTVPETAPGEPRAPARCAASPHPFAVPLTLLAGAGAVAAGVGQRAVALGAGVVLLGLGALLIFSLGWMGLGAGTALVAAAWLAGPPPAAA